jgi:heat shock protein HslJ
VSGILLGGLVLSLLHCSHNREKDTSDAQVTPSKTSGSLPLALDSTSWRLVKFQGGDGTTLEPDDRNKYTVTFGTDGRLSARVNCNRGMGTWKSNGHQLELSPLALTRAYCPPEPIYDHLVKQWESLRSYLIRDGHLYLSLMADGGSYEFEPMKGMAGLGLDLEKTYWKLTQLGGAPVRGTQTEPNLVLDPTTRRVGGSGGCNQFSGGYQLDGSQLRMSQTVSTMKACTNAMDTEKAFLDALGQVRQWRITGQELELLDSAGTVLARFEGRRSFH